MFYVIVAIWAVVCFIRCVLTPEERKKFADILK